jgi:hypothetical protein
MFLYLLNGNLSREALTKAQLSHLPDAATLIQRSLLDGPAGAGRTLFADGRMPAERLYYRPNEQTWQKSANGQFWLGYWNDMIPTAESLKRKSIIAGHPAELGGRGSFIIPLARKFPAGTALPMTMVLTAEGLTLKEKPQFVGFSARAEKLWRNILRQMDWLAADANDTLTAQEQFELCVEALGINYHLGADEVSMLGLIDTVSLNDIACLMVDIPGLKQDLPKMLERVKKKDCAYPPDSSSGSVLTGSGPPDGSDTAPQ